MRNVKAIFGMAVALGALGFGARAVQAQDKAAPGSVQVHMVITDEGIRDSAEVAILRAENLQVKQGKTALKIDAVIPARGDSAALQLFILIDDTSDITSIGNNLNDVRDFINAQAPTTVVGIGYMSNAAVQIVQNFTPDHAAAAKAVRLPLGTTSTMDSPYLSLISLIKGWPEQKVRREVLMISDGIDRLRGQRESDIRSPRSAYPGPSRGLSNNMSVSMTTISPDVDTASTASQRYGVIVHGIYTPGVGRVGRNAWEAQVGQAGVAQIAEQSGGEYFSLGTQNLISFKPYLDRLQKVFENQYFLVFRAVPKNKPALQRVNISTEVKDFEIAAADNVWVPTTGARDGAAKK
jgi:hypothetical protein